MVVEALMQCPAAGVALHTALMNLPDCDRLLPRTAQLFAVVSASREAGGGTGSWNEDRVTDNDVQK